MKAILPAGVVIVGLLVLLLGLSWGSLFPPTREWTPEKNDKLTKLGTEITRLRFAIVQAENNPRMHSGENAAELKAQHVELRKEYDVLQKEFETARDSPAATGKTLKWLGIIITAGGALFAFANRQAT
jgi:hypothetical protein